MRVANNGRQAARRKMPYPALNSQQDTLMAYTTFSQTKNDQLKEPMFFGQQRIGELVSVHVIPRPHGDLEEVFPIGLKGDSSNL